MQLAKPMSGGRQTVYHCVAALALGLLFGVFGPFGTNPVLDISTRYAFWVGLILFGYGAARIAALTLLRGGGIGRRNRVVRLILVILLSAVPTTFAAAWTLTYVQPGRVIAPGGLFALYGAVLCVQAVLALVEQYVSSLTGALPHPPTTAVQAMDIIYPDQSPSALPATSRFMDRLPAYPGGALLALEAVDHYLRVHRENGNVLIYMRLADAISELQGSDGLQVHRSWWVAGGAVIQSQRQGARTILRLANDLVVPVSRTYVMAVRQMGWTFSPA